MRDAGHQESGSRQYRVKALAVERRERVGFVQPLVVLLSVDIRKERDILRGLDIGAGRTCWPTYSDDLSWQRVNRNRHRMRCEL